jgi:hypothetical protein
MSSVGDQPSRELAGGTRMPIRRYPDLVVHRALLRELGTADEPLPEDLSELAAHTSARERAAADLEHAADDICLGWLLDATLFERGWETTFEGEIVGLIGSGLFARFGDVFEGFLPARRGGLVIRPVGWWLPRSSWSRSRSRSRSRFLASRRGRRSRRSRRLSL